MLDPRSRIANVCPVAVPGVMMGLEISTAQCRGCRGGADRCRFVEMLLLTVAWALYQQDDGPSGIAVSGGE